MMADRTCNQLKCVLPRGLLWLTGTVALAPAGGHKNLGLFLPLGYGFPVRDTDHLVGL